MQAEVKYWGGERKGGEVELGNIQYQKREREEEESNMHCTDMKVPDLGDGAGGKGRLQDRKTVWGSGSRDRGRNTRHAHPMGGALTGVGLGVSPH